MAFTRAQATALLNASEMKLFDESRAQAIRGLDRAALALRVERTRAARDRARDLLKRQRLAARRRGEGRGDDVAARTARKEAVLVELLERFTTARREAPASSRATAKKATGGKATARKAATKNAATKASPARKAATRKAAKKTAAKKTATRKPAAKKAVTRVAAKKTATRKAATRNGATKNAATKKAATRTAVPRKSAKRAPARKASRSLTPERALENTRRLLAAKQERDRTPQPWQALDPVVEHVPQPGFQSPEAAGKAQALHEGEARIAPIQGSNSTRDRRNQGRRDHRGDTE